jgi:hypothetical protein
MEWRLYLGSKNTGIVVRPDEKYPSMFRVHWPDRPPSDMVNLTRAKDAAQTWAARLERDRGNHTASDRLPFKWKGGG